MNPATPPSELMAANPLRTELSAFLRFAVCDLVPGLTKIVDAYRRYTVPKLRVAAWENLALSSYLRIVRTDVLIVEDILLVPLALLALLAPLALLVPLVPLALLALLVPLAL